MRIWITRTQPQAEETADKVRALGHEALVAPVLECRAIAGVNIDLAGVSALAFSSRNAVAVFAGLSPQRDLPVFAVGDATAADARDLGFTDVRSADGDVHDLARLIAAAAPTGTVLQPGAKALAGDLAGELSAAGILARALPIYETVETHNPAPAGVEAVLIHSPRAAKRVAELVSPQQAAAMTAFVISTAAAAPLASSKFSRVAVAPYPNEPAMLKLLGEA